MVLPTRPPRRARLVVFLIFLRRGEGRGSRGGEAALNQFSQELGDTFQSPLLRGASLDADAVGARIIAGATRATEATGREAVAVAEADVAALLAAGARGRRRRARSRTADGPQLGRVKNAAVARAARANDRLAILALTVLDVRAVSKRVVLRTDALTFREMSRRALSDLFEVPRTPLLALANVMSEASFQWRSQSLEATLFQTLSRQLVAG